MRIKSLLLVLLLLSAVALCLAQDTPKSPGFHPPARPIPPASLDDETRAKMEQDMAKAANKQRQEQIKTDTDKLLALATELKQYVDKSNENTLSLDVVRKAEEIEKLAHTVKEKMKGT